MFTKAILMPSNKMIDQAAKAEQERRLEQIREGIQLMEETFDPFFELKPETKQERYFKRLAKGAISNTLTQTQEDAVSMEVQTEKKY